MDYKSQLKIGSELLYLTKDECVNMGITVTDALPLIEKVLAQYSKKQVEMPAKIGIHPLNKDTFLHAMPAYIPEDHACGIKWVGGFPENRKKYGLPHITGLIVLNDDQTGVPFAIMDATLITTMRTVAVTLIGAKYFGSKNAETFGMIGCGELGKKHVEFAGATIPNLKEIYIYDKYESAMDALIELVQPKISAKIIKARSIEEIAKSCSIIASATVFTTPNPEIKDEWIQPGQTILLCDSHVLYEDKTIKRGDKYIIDSLDQMLLFNEYGYYPDGMPKVYGELGEVIAGTKKGRENEQELIINNNIGMAIEDIILAQAFFNKAMEKGVGQKIPL
jgi:ornithine cyclodeaminase/alanine dehydrogenase